MNEKTIYLVYVTWPHQFIPATTLEYDSAADRDKMAALYLEDNADKDDVEFRQVSIGTIRRLN